MKIGCRAILKGRSWIISRGLMAQILKFSTKNGSNAFGIAGRAVCDSGGIPAISEFARQNADKYPRANTD